MLEDHLSEDSIRNAKRVIKGLTWEKATALLLDIIDDIVENYQEVGDQMDAIMYRLHSADIKLEPAESTK